MTESTMKVSARTDRTCVNFNGSGPEFELPISLLSREPAEMETVYSAVVCSQTKGKGMGRVEL